MVCKKCGNSLESDALFCGACGEKVNVMQSDGGQVCPMCGSISADDAVFCGGCGYKFGSEFTPRQNVTQRQSVKKEGDNKKLYITAVIVAVVALFLVCVVFFNDFSLYGIPVNPENEKPVNTQIPKSEKPQKTKAPEKTKKPVKTEVPETDGDYLFPSDKKYITLNDLAGKTQEEVALIRNEIYARHGYIFTNEEYYEYFSQKDWYRPNPNFSEEMFSEIENKNKSFIVEYEKMMGWR